MATAAPSSPAACFPRDYAGSLAALDSTQQRGASLRRAYDTRTQCLAAMRVYLRRVGLDEAALARIPTLHVTGSKGKGSTCAFVEAVLRAKGLRTGEWVRKKCVGVGWTVSFNRIESNLITDNMRRPTHNTPLS